MSFNITGTDLVNAGLLWDPRQWPKNNPSSIDHGDTAWMIMSLASVFFMTPGIGLLYGGLICKRSVTTAMMQVKFE